MDKQRTLVLGLNKDLERALEDKERYRSKLKETLDKQQNMPNNILPPVSSQLRGISQSPVPSEASTELPIQRQSLDPEPIIPEATVRPLTLRGPRTNNQSEAEQNSPKEPVERTADPTVRAETTAHHTQNQTSSSNVNVFQTNGAPQIPLNQTRHPAPLRVDIEGQRSPQNSPGARPGMSPTISFTAKRSQNQSSKPFNAPDILLPVSAPTQIASEVLTPPRKPPPAPLDLGSTKVETLSPSKYGPEDHSGSEYEDNLEPEPTPVERGRKKTREDDDRDREVALSKQEEERSRSKKEKASKSRSESLKKDEDQNSQPQVLPLPPTFKALAPEPTPLGTSTFLSQPVSLAGVLNPQEPNKGSDIVTRTLSATPLSPGLPVSPRPADRPMNPPTPRLPRDGTGHTLTSPPLSPKTGMVGLPLSPRAPRQPIPFPPNTPMSVAPMSPKTYVMDTRKDSTSSGQASMSSGRNDSSVSEHTEGDPLMPQKQVPAVLPSRGVFKGFVSEAYPNLLIPPNALPSIKVKVVSSRLKPSRHSLVLKGDDEPVFTLGVSARYDRQDLWQVEKAILSLQQLDHQLRQSSGFGVKLPDRFLFSGHAPARVDARRVALETYFESVLDTQLDERAAIALCTYLSTNVSEPEAAPVNSSITTSNANPSIPLRPDKKLRKDGYLTKRGKNFGGWKSRYFVLDKPVLEYYESPGSKGGPLGQIKLQNAQIGKQSPKASASPSRSEESEGQYRHAFLIREPKRKDSSSFVDHVLCAESDGERDAWVSALLCYVEGSGSEYDNKPKTQTSAAAPVLPKIIPPAKKNSLKNEVGFSESPDSETFEGLQSVPYEETRQAQAPHVSISPDPKPVEIPSPTASGVHPPLRTPSSQSKTISGPQNGAKISDVGAWGNKPMTTLLSNPRDQKKRSLFSFRDNKSDHGVMHPANGSNLNLTQEQQDYQEHATNVKAVFGIPLAEAVHFCAPRGIDVCLPAVVYRCLEYLEIKDAASEEGIFRMSGSNNLIKHLRHKFNTEGDFDFLRDGETYFDVHAVASLLKLYLRELPSMILTKQLHMQFLSVLDLKDDARKVAAYNVLVHKLPKPNYSLIRALCAYLIAVVNNSDVNKMGVRNVCIVFSPTLNIPSPAFTMFLSAFEEIFETEPDPENNLNVPALETSVPSPDTLTPDDIRSPRKQMFSDLPTPSFNQASFGMTPQPVHQHQIGSDMGFAPLQPAYEGPMSIPYSQTQAPGSVTVPGPEYTVTRPRDLAPSGDARARRRESSLLMLGPGQKKSSLPSMRSTDSGTFEFVTSSPF